MIAGWEKSNVRDGSPRRGERLVATERKQVKERFGETKRARPSEEAEEREKGTDKPILSRRRRTT